jgi:hypothetical protein
MKLKQGHCVSTAAITEENFQPVIDAFRMSGCKINAFFNAENVKYFQFLEWHKDHLAKTKNIANGEMLLTVDQILGRAPIPEPVVYDFSRTPNSGKSDWLTSVDGLPPVGTVCEVLNNALGQSAQWEKCTILFMGKFKCVYDSESCRERIGNVDLTGDVHFRPLKTERERAIEDILDIYHNGDDIGQIDNVKELATALYDAGYRKGEK